MGGKYRLYTVKETAQIFKKSEKTIYRWIKKKIIENPIKVSDGYLIRADSVEKIIKKTVDKLGQIRTN